MTLVNVAFTVWVLTANLDWLLPGASNTASDTAYSIDGLFKFMAVFCFAICIYVNGYVLYFAIVFRRRRGEAADTIGVQVHDMPKLEFWWTAIPTVLLVILMIYSYVVWRQIYFPPTAAALTTEVIGHQFNWEFRYPGLKGSVFNEMHLPVGQPVRVLITSGDVIHQFWIPEFRVKTAAVPGLVTDLNFTPSHAGTYTVSCSEYCGVNHSKMQAKLVVEEPAAFDKWLAQEATATAQAAPAIALASGNAAAGKALFAQKCTVCHAIAPFDQKVVGPGLLHITDDPQHPNLVDNKPPTPDDIAEILEKGFTGPIGTMPDRQANALSDTDIANLVAYLTSLK